MAGSGGGYGYTKRNDPPPRSVGGQTSRVTLPNKEETRRTDIVSKTNFGVPATILSNVDDILLFPKLTAAQTFVGKNNEILGGATTRWNADIKRYSKNQSQNASVSAHRFQIGFSPRALVDPLFNPSGILVKVQDHVRAFFQGIDNAQHAKAVMTVGPQAGSSSPAPEPACVGWRAMYLGSGQPTWITQYVSKTGGITRQIDSGVQCDTPHTISIIFDGKLQQIRWYLDGVLVDTYSPSSGEVGGQNALIGRESVQFICNSSNGFPGPGFGATFDYLMLGAPLVTIQFPDA